MTRARFQAWSCVAVLSALAVPLAAPADETRSAPPGHVAPAATVDDLQWLAGEWVGDGISGPAREIYSAPMGGAMAGHFVQMGAQGVAFYEFVTIAPDGPSLAYRIKHFNADMTGWSARSGSSQRTAASASTCSAIAGRDDGSFWFLCDRVSGGMPPEICQHG